jgi:hypothetical protein
LNNEIERMCKEGAMLYLPGNEEHQKANHDCVSGQYFNLDLAKYEAGISFT